MSLFDKLFRRRSKGVEPRRETRPEPSPATPQHGPPRCPYCSAELAKRPQRKTKCPHCSGFIYVKRPFGSPQGTKALMTEAQRDAEEAKWRAAQSHDRWARDLSAVGISEAEFEQEHQRLGANDDGITAAHHILSAILGSGGDLQRLKMAALLMVQVASAQGRDPMPFKETVYRLGLEQMRDHARAVMIKAPPPGPHGPDRRTGPQCERWAGREFAVDEALREMPLPCGVDCVCEYSPIFKWE